VDRGICNVHWQSLGETTKERLALLRRRRSNRPAWQFPQRKNSKTKGFRGKGVEEDSHRGQEGLSRRETESRGGEMHSSVHVSIFKGEKGRGRVFYQREGMGSKRSA